MEPVNFYKKGIALLHQRDFESAAAALIAAIKQRKIFPEAYKALCVAYKELGDLHKAGQCAQLAAESFILQSKLKEAAALYVHSRKLNLDLENPFKKLGEASLRKGKPDAGAKLLSLASQCQPEDKQLACKAALAWKASGNAAQAVRILEKALENGPFSTGASLYEELTGHPWEATSELNNPAAELEASMTPPPDTVSTAPDGEQQPDKEAQEQREKRDKRRAQRYPLFGYYVRVGKDKEEYEVLNLSSTGIAFAVPARQLTPGDSLALDLFGMEGLLGKKLPVTLRHVTEGAAGCSFGKLNKKQRAVVDALIKPQHKDDFVDDLVVDTDKPLDLGSW